MIPSIKFEYSNSSLKLNLLKATGKIPTVVYMYAQTKAPQIESEMKIGRKWIDRTGQAKATLRATPSKTDNIIRITLSHGVEYGIWLELANEQNYAIIIPTIKKQATIIIKDLNYLFEKIML